MSASDSAAADDDRARAAIAAAFSWLSTPSVWNSLAAAPQTAASAWDAAFSGADAPTPQRLESAVARLRELVAACFDEMQPRFVVTEDVLGSDDLSATRRQRAVEALRESVTNLAKMLSSLRDQESFATLISTHSGGVALENLASSSHSLAAARVALARIAIATGNASTTAQSAPAFQ